MPVDTIFFKPLTKSMVIVHYIPGLFFCLIGLLKGKSGSRRLPDSPSFLLNIQNPTLQPGESGSHRLPDSPNPRLAKSGSRFSITNISANSKPKSKGLRRWCKGSMRNQFLQNPRKSASLPCPFKMGSSQMTGPVVLIGSHVTKYIKCSKPKDRKDYTSTHQAGKTLHKHKQGISMNTA
jgi:hypothetical protein